VITIKEAELIIPQHIGIIMDGNGRWAEKRGLQRIEGHRAGEAAIMEVVRACVGLGVQALTLFAFSTENWSRPPEEVLFLVNMSKDILQRRLDEFNSLGVRMRHLGLREGLPDEVLRWFDLAAETTRENGKMTLVIAFNYGGRREILDAASTAAKKIAAGELSEEEKGEELIKQFLYIPELPDIDLLIRTGGEKRLSNFMLWHLAYAELYFTDILWPDFSRNDLEEAIRDYQRRERKFGSIKE
jgi:undecaprenyl diphosphate synthase